MGLLASMELDRFEEILAASPKRFREELFRQAGLRKKASAYTLKSQGEDARRSERLLAALRDGSGPSAEHVEELVRNYLYSHRDLLGDALDFLGVPHDGGLTDQDLDFVEALPPEKGRELRDRLMAKFASKDVALYLAFMSVPGA